MTIKILKARLFNNVTIMNEKMVFCFNMSLKISVNLELWYKIQLCNLFIVYSLKLGSSNRSIRSMKLTKNNQTKTHSGTKSPTNYGKKWTNVCIPHDDILTFDLSNLFFIEGRDIYSIHNIPN